MQLLRTNSNNKRNYFVKGGDMIKRDRAMTVAVTVTVAVAVAVAVAVTVAETMTVPTSWSFFRSLRIFISLYLTTANLY